MPYTDKNKQNEYQRLWVKKRRENFLSDKTCVDCGSNKNLQLDHINPKIKTSHRIWSWNEERRKKEIEKCQILCPSCHAKKTHKQNGTESKHGTHSKYTMGCRCEYCKNAHIEAQREYRRNKKRIIIGE